MAHMVLKLIYSNRKSNFLQKQALNNLGLFSKRGMASHSYIVAVFISLGHCFSAIYDSFKVIISLFRIRFFQIFKL